MELPSRLKDPLNVRQTSAVRVSAIAYIIWNTVMCLFMTYVLTCAAIASRASGNGYAAIPVLGFSIPLWTGLVFLGLLTAAVGAGGYLVGIAVLRGPKARRRPAVRRVATALLYLSAAGILWAFSQGDAVVLLVFMVSALMVFALRWVVDRYGTAPDAYLEDAAAANAPDAENSLASMGEAFIDAVIEPTVDEDAPVSLSRDGWVLLQRRITGYSQLMAIWGSLELLMAMTYLARITSMDTHMSNFVTIMGSAIVTGALLAIQGAFFILLTVLTVKGAIDRSCRRIGVGLCIAGLFLSVSVLLLVSIGLLMGSPDGVEQVFCSVLSCGLLGVVYSCTDRRLRVLRLASELQ